jgi:hypothetical protein
MRRTMTILGVSILVLAAAAAYLLLTPGSTDFLKKRQVVTDAKTVNSIASGFVRNPYKDDYDMTRIAGYVDNLGGDKLARVVFEIRLLDPQGNKKERVTYVVENVAPHARKTFDANAGQIAGARTAEARITEVDVLK